LDHGFHFNLLGIFNTPKETSIYTVTAEIFDHSFEIKAVDWETTTKRSFIFAGKDNQVEFRRYFEVHPNTSIVFKVSRYCLDTL
jgi:hypothetical protein